MINTVLFDMDGLLLDTELYWGDSMLKIAAQEGIPITRERFKETTGLRIFEAIFARYLFGAAPMLTLMKGETSRVTVDLIFLPMLSTVAGSLRLKGSHAHISSMLRTCSTWMQSSTASTTR